MKNLLMLNNIDEHNATSVYLELGPLVRGPERRWCLVCRTAVKHRECSAGPQTRLRFPCERKHSPKSGRSECWCSQTTGRKKDINDNYNHISSNELNYLVELRRSF